MISEPSAATLLPYADPEIVRTHGQVCFFRAVISDRNIQRERESRPASRPVCSASRYFAVRCDREPYVDRPALLPPLLPLVVLQLLLVAAESHLDLINVLARCSTIGGDGSQPALLQLLIVLVELFENTFASRVLLLPSLLGGAILGNAAPGDGRSDLVQPDISHLIWAAGALVVYAVLLVNTADALETDDDVARKGAVEYIIT